WPRDIRAATSTLIVDSCAERSWFDMEFCAGPSGGPIVDGSVVFGDNLRISLVNRTLVVRSTASWVLRTSPFARLLPEAGGRLLPPPLAKHTFLNLQSPGLIISPGILPANLPSGSTNLYGLLLAYQYRLKLPALAATGSTARNLPA